MSTPRGTESSSPPTDDEDEDYIPGKPETPTNFKRKSRKKLKKRKDERGNNSAVSLTASNSGRIQDPINRLAVDQKPFIPLTIHSLPEEVLIKVFQYLGHGDQLTSRLVSNLWNKVMSSWKGFNGNVVYLIKRRTQSLSVFEQTQVPWKKLRIEKFRLNDIVLGNFILPLNLVNVVSSVEFSKSSVSWDRFQSILLQFGALEEVNIIQRKRKRKEVSSPGVPLRVTPASQQFSQQLENVLGKVTSVSLELRRVQDILFYLTQLNKHGVSRLVNLVVTEVCDRVETIHPNMASDLHLALLTLVQRSNMTLKKLQINFITLNVMNSFFVEFMSKIVEDQDRLPLDLIKFEVRHFARQPYNHRDLQIYSKFIEKQKNLLEIWFPVPQDVPFADCAAVTQLLTKTVRQMHVTSDNYMVGNFFDRFPELRHFGCDFEMRKLRLWFSGRKKYLNLQSLEIQNEFHFDTFSFIVATFPNLMTLNLSGSHEHNVRPMDNHTLQAICKHLKQIKYLVLGDCWMIGDYGVTGVSSEYCENLFQSRSLCLDSTLQVPMGEISGCPISSLKGLTHLTFCGPTGITDVGIFYGFRFQELRHFSMKNSNNITDWGMDWLGKLNKNLDSVDFGCGQCVTTVGISHLRSHLHRIKRRNLRFTRPNKEYYSSDES